MSNNKEVVFFCIKKEKENNKMHMFKYNVKDPLNKHRLSTLFGLLLIKEQACKNAAFIFYHTKETTHTAKQLKQLFSKRMFVKILIFCFLKKKQIK